MIDDWNALEEVKTANKHALVPEDEFIDLSCLPKDKVQSISVTPPTIVNPLMNLSSKPKRAKKKKGAKKPSHTDTANNTMQQQQPLQIQFYEQPLHEEDNDEWATVENKRL